MQEGILFFSVVTKGKIGISEYKFQGSSISFQLKTNHFINSAHSLSAMNSAHWVL